jgi:hypothetical protein
VAEEFVAGHTQPPRRRSQWKNSRTGDGRAQHGLAHEPLWGGAGRTIGGTGRSPP